MASYHAVQMPAHHSTDRASTLPTIGLMGLVGVTALVVGMTAGSSAVSLYQAPAVQTPTATRVIGSMPAARPVTRSYAASMAVPLQPASGDNAQWTTYETQSSTAFRSPIVALASMTGFAALGALLAKLMQSPAPVSVMAVSGEKTSNDWLSPEAMEKASLPKANKFEKIKLAKPGESAWEDSRAFAAAVRSGEYEWDEIDKDDLDIRLKWAGLFHRPKGKGTAPGQFMQRLKVPNGIVTTEAWRGFSEIIAKYGDATLDTVSGGCVDITTRMNIQLRGLKVEDFGDALDIIDKVGLTSKQSGMDNVRNMVGNPIAGVDPEELIDTRPFCIDIQNFITNSGAGNPEFSNLPRKFNIAVSGSRDDFSHTNINDIGLIPVPLDGVMGFNVDIGGYFSIKRVAEGYPMNLWIPGTTADGELDTSVAVAFCKAVLTHFRDNGDRGDRQKARLIWLVEKLGMDEWHKQVMDIMAEQSPEAAAACLDKAPYFDDGVKPKRNIVGVHKSKTEGECWVGAVVPAGRLVASEMAEIARVAEKYSKSETRITVDQNIIFPYVADADVPAMLAEPLFTKGNIKVDAGPLMRGFVSCTGAQFCPLAMVETKNRATSIILDLESRLSFPEDSPDVRIHFTGCPNSCGQAQVGNIGLMGGPARKLNEETGKKVAVEGFNIFLGGQQGEAPELGEIHEKGVIADDITPYLEDLLVEKFGATRVAA